MNEWHYFNCVFSNFVHFQCAKSVSEQILCAWSCGVHMKRKLVFCFICEFRQPEKLQDEGMWQSRRNPLAQCVSTGMHATKATVNQQRVMCHTLFISNFLSSQTHTLFWHNINPYQHHPCVRCVYAGKIFGQTSVV